MYRAVCFDVYYPSDANNHSSAFVFKTAKEASVAAKKMAEDTGFTGVSYWAEREGSTKKYLGGITQ
jgi:hypothetical protein